MGLLSRFRYILQVLGDDVRQGGINKPQPCFIVSAYSFDLCNMRLTEFGSPLLASPCCRCAHPLPHHPLSHRMRSWLPRTS
jgi:hypothetical protein